MADVPLYTRGTIVAGEVNFKEQAEKLRAALKGLGTDEDALIHVLTHMSNSQRQELKAAYKTTFDRDMIADIRDDISGYFEQTVLALLTPAREYDVINLEKAMTTEGDRRILVDLLCAQRTENVEKIKTDFQKKYGRSVEESVGKSLKGDFKALVLALLNSNRSVDIRFVEEEVKSDANNLYKAGEGRLGTDESAFIQILTTRSFEHLRHVYAEYKKISGNTIENAIQSETSAEFKNGLLGIVMYSRDPLGYYSARIMKSMRGLGTDDDSLIRIIVSRAELDLVEIKSNFIKTYKKTVQGWIEGDTSGDYRKILVAIVRGNGDSSAAPGGEALLDLPDGDIDPSKPFMPAEVE